MPRTIQLASEDELPAGPRRRFAEALYRIWITAGRPATTRLSNEIKKRDFAGSPSKEAIRTMLSGKVVPQVWENAEAVFIVLSEAAGLDPERMVSVDSDHGFAAPEIGPAPAREIFREFWQAAQNTSPFLHAPMEDYTPPTRTKGGFGAWEIKPIGEPPF